MQVRQDFNAQISKSQAYWTKRKGMEIIQGSVTEQYSRLWDYAEEIRRINDGSTVKMLVDTQDSSGELIFKRFYVSFAALK